MDDIRNVLEANTEIAGALVQYTRQKMDDRYDMHEVIRTIKDVRDIPVLTDDNYAVMKVKHIGIQCGAQFFHAFLLLSSLDRRESGSWLERRNMWISLWS